jgi:hypothetical protein
MNFHRQCSKAHGATAGVTNRGDTSHSNMLDTECHTCSQDSVREQGGAIGLIDTAEQADDGSMALVRAEAGADAIALYSRCSTVTP